ncbi:amino acid ABC transporter permease (plasmid) [Agrobacterium leguminum]|uniref:ABC-type amino acid transport system, permease component n=1 Tax=Agrobacterium deltaense NCPPB 1641 TaxID=1183425 RepID=A0A1S7UBW1_9HYPH|nr:MULTISPECIES: amino acid ABC transporter permease [Agrobacterium]WFS69760.1 amino acid ABC transporter permease [Agrobacterium leguminum]CVI64071.1 putative ABC-type amino acid transport system, permease component [Agrobacterium deltaense NCPPB 1641]
MEATTFGYQEFLFLLQGLKWTILLTAISFVGGGVIGLLVALARTSESKPLRVFTSGYIAVFQGTPLLMQLFVVYYGVALLNLNIQPWLAVTLAYTAHASAFLGDIWRGSISALPKGQTEAAQALGIHYFSRMKDVILPQAFKISLPATIGFSVQLLKGTSLAAIVGFIELARAGQIVSNQTFQPLLVFGVVGAMFFVVCWPLSFAGRRLERRLAVGTAR